MKMHVDKIAGIRLHHVRSDIILVSFAAQQVRGLYQPSPRQKLQSGPRARRCGTRLRLLWAKWVRLWIVSFLKKYIMWMIVFLISARNAMSTYNSRGLPGMNSCFFCGANCDLCRPGITITMSAQSMAAYSFSCLFLGLTVFLVFVG